MKFYCLSSNFKNILRFDEFRCYMLLKNELFKCFPKASMHGMAYFRLPLALCSPLQSIDLYSPANARGYLNQFFTI